MPITKAYVRYRGDLPESHNIAIAMHGFDELGMKVIPFQGFGDISTIDCGAEALVHGFIGDVQQAMLKMGLGVPPPLDYPESLRGFLGRRIWRAPLSEVRNHNRIFVKPVAQKLFTGLLWEKSRGQRLHLAPYPDSTECFFADPVTFVSEYRCYILDGDILSVRFYKGDWEKTPSRKTLEAAVRAFVSSGEAPRGCVLDFGVTASGETLLVEANDGFAVGNYGLPPTPYARLIEARWEELTQPLLERPL